MKQVAKDIFWLDCNDRDIDIFEGIYLVKGIGMAYNSYVIMDDKIAVMDTVDAAVGEEWLAKLDEVLAGRKPDYLVVQHMEPDHSQHIGTFMKKFPQAIIVSSQQAFTMMKNFFGEEYENRRQVIKEGDVLDLGQHKLNFIAAPMVHWPEVMLTYDSTAKVLFSADGFGKFGCSDYRDNWVTEARRYYTGIVGKYGFSVQSVLKKAATLDIQVICPLHGWVLTENLGIYIDLYDKWSKHEPEMEGVAIYYASVYGRTEQAALYLAEECRKAGIENVLLWNLMRSDATAAVADSFRVKNLVLCSMTYNMDVSPFMSGFIGALVLHSLQNKRVAFIENGSWAPNAGKVMRAAMEQGKNMQLLDTITIRSAMSEENKAQLRALAAKLKE